MQWNILHPNSMIGALVTFFLQNYYQQQKLRLQSDNFSHVDALYFENENFLILWDLFACLN